MTDEDLYDIYGKADSVEDGLLAIGKHASSDNLDVYLDIHKLVLRHAPNDDIFPAIILTNVPICPSL